MYKNINTTKSHHRQFKTPNQAEVLLKRPLDLGPPVNMTFSSVLTKSITMKSKAVKLD